MILIELPFRHSHVQILIAFAVLTFNFMNKFLQITHWSHSIMVWSFSENNNVVVFYFSLDVKIATRCKNDEVLITKIGTLNGILLLIFVTLCKVNLDDKVIGLSEAFISWYALTCLRLIWICSLKMATFSFNISMAPFKATSILDLVIFVSTVCQW